MRMPPSLQMDSGDSRVLHGWVERGDAGPAVARRARIVLLCSEGLGPAAVAQALGCSKQTVITWRERYRTDGLDGLRDAPRSGRPASVDPESIVLRTLQVPAGPSRRWTSRSLAAELDISNVAVANIWRRCGIKPLPGGQVSLLTEPTIDDPVVDVLGVCVTAGTAVLAVAVGDLPAVRAAPRGLGRDAGHRLTELVTAVGHDASALPEFLTLLDDQSHRPVRLVVSGAAETVDTWVRARAGVTLHGVVPPLAWERLVGVGCLIAGVHPDGAASVDALRAAVLVHPGRRPFVWVGDRSSAST